jgi:hypothetical protein
VHSGRKRNYFAKEKPVDQVHKSVDRAGLIHRDDKWGPPVSRAWRGVKAARGEASRREGGGNRAGRHRRAAGWAERAGWVGREVEAQWGEGERPVEKKSGHNWAERPDGPTGRWAD